MTHMLGNKIGPPAVNKLVAATAWWLRLAAAPTFALMALLTAAFTDGRLAVICSAAASATPIDGMVLMYLLMSAFHLPPWLVLMAGARNIPEAR
ncbi:hypothetical protein [Nitratireductor thuwali]|uniref:Uncharacterized protein n=1 Tax=Nitratireductor thuwali TaxID=2267699 RepID=A0ABY5MIJ7_9HYPH|nr:hypothetical protein NTH_02300 [Nitratireductor thuwali]